MKRLLAVVLLTVCVPLAVPVQRAFAQTPAPATTDTTEAETTDDGETKPWGRLAIFIPLSIAIGAAAVYGGRVARERGWLST